MDVFFFNATQHSMLQRDIFMGLRIESFLKFQLIGWGYSLYVLLIDQTTSFVYLHKLPIYNANYISIHLLRDDLL